MATNNQSSHRPVVSERQLGKNGPKVSSIGYGAMGLSVSYGKAGSDEERFQILDRAIELGCTYFDSADIYGDNEELLAKYFKKYPQQRRKVCRKIFFVSKICTDVCRYFLQQSLVSPLLRICHRSPVVVMHNTFENPARKVLNDWVSIPSISFTFIVSIKMFPSKKQ